MDNNKQLSFALSVLKTLNNAGHEAFFAGGCVRDELLGRTRPHDFDIATKALPDQVSTLFNCGKSVGRVFGVVLVKEGDNQVEVATFRKDSSTSDGRRPDSVKFSTARNDAKRRDFTVNGLFKNPFTGKILDFVGGLKDLEKKEIRCIGIPDNRFQEDHLRLLRAIRFTSKLDFSLNNATSESMKRNAFLLGDVSRERIGEELFKMLGDKSFVRSLKLLEFHHFDEFVLKDQNKDSPKDFPVSTNLSNKETNVSNITKLASWLLDRCPHGKSLDDKCRNILLKISQTQNALSLTNQQTHNLDQILDITSQLSLWDSLTIARKMRLLGSNSFDDAFKLFRAAASAKGNLVKDIQELLDSGDDFHPLPFITGKDLIEKGLKPGPEFRDILEEFFDRQLSHEFADKQEALEVLLIPLRSPGN